MRRRLLQLVIVMSALLAWPGTGYAQQEATLSGTVKDSMGLVMPGVSVRAVHAASGNNFEAVTDERGSYRMPVRAGGYQVTIELSGFETVMRTAQLLVGQEAVVNVEMALSGLTETLTVTGEAPLVDVTKSALGGNVDPRQMEALPVSGRNWQDLAVLAPGSQATGAGRPVSRERTDYQLNMDGIQVTNNTTSGNNAVFSLDSVAEFKFLSGRFDATQGRASGVQLLAISKGGSNAFRGSVGSYFRDDRFNSADPVAKRVIPDKNQQVSLTFGGPIKKNKMHFFGNYEYGRTPSTIVYTSPYARFNIDQKNNRWQHNGGARVDMEITPRARLMVRGYGWTEINPFSVAGSATAHPSSQGSVHNHADGLIATWTQVVSNRGVNELKSGQTRVYTAPSPVVQWPNHPQFEASGGFGTPRFALRSYTIGHSNTNWPFKLQQTSLPFVRDDFSYSAGRHQLKVGGEYIPQAYWLFNCRNCAGVYDAQGGPVPSNIEDLFPVWDDVTTWNLNALNPIIRTYQIGIGDFRGDVPRKTFAGWVQDDWSIASRLTLNLGLRYDLETDGWSNWVEVPNILKANRPNDTNNVAPRLGFAYTLTPRTVLRGGWGVYYGTINNTQGSFTLSARDVFIAQVQNDGRADFATNPFNGPLPTYEQLLARWESGGPVRTTAGAIAAPDMQQPVSYHGSMGVQRQLGSTISVEADYTFKLARHESYTDNNVNLTFDPVTGVNLPSTVQRPILGWGVVQMLNMNASSDYHALQTAFTKRFSHRWQASATYTLSRLTDCDPLPRSGLELVTFAVAPDLGGECSLATSDQRHRAVFNGIWQLPLGFETSALYYFGSGERFATSYGGDLRGRGTPTSPGRLRPNGTIVPRNNFVGKPIHRMDLRTQRRFAAGRGATADLMVDVFNVFNHANYGAYTTEESSANYGKPSQSSLTAHAPRTLQLGFKVTF